MNTEQAEKQLNRIAKYDNLIERTLNELEKWRMRAESTGTYSNGERVQTTPDPHSKETIWVMYTEQQARCKRKIQQYSRERERLVDLVDQLDGLEHEVISLIYVERMLGSEVAVELDKSQSTITKAKGKGLAIIQQILESGDTNERT